MIFDCPKIIALREKYRGLANYEVPKIVSLDRSDRYEGEKQFFESLIASVNPNKQNDWMGRLVNEEDQQHIGAWFEIMLFGWLRNHFNVQVGPEVLGNYPDFILDIRDKYLAIEAKAFLISPEDRARRVKFNRILSLLESIEKPFFVTLRVKSFGEKIEPVDLVKKVTRWLDSAADRNFIYRDNLGNTIYLSASFMSTNKKVNVIRAEGFRVNPDVLKSPLKKKAKQHNALRKAGYPYIIAIFLEPEELSTEEVIAAWIGKISIVYDIDSNQVVDEELDKSGLHYFRNEILYKSVTGTLVFKAGYDEIGKSRYLQSWYVQNPHAKVVMDPDVFPVESRFVVVGQDDKTFEMKWVK